MKRLIILTIITTTLLSYPAMAYPQYSEESKRTDPELVRCVEELGEEANGSFAKLEVIEIPDDVIWMITDYDGIEQVEEARSVWR